MLHEEFLFHDVDIPCAAPADSMPFAVDSHGSEIYGRVLMPARMTEAELHPVVVMLHGFPGWEMLADIPHALRRVGVAVAHFSHRGVWGSHGDYSFSHLSEDAFCVLQHLCDHAAEYHIDPARIYLIGYSMGGFATMHTLAQGAGARGAVLISPCDIGEVYFSDKATYDMLMARQSLGCLRLSAPDALSRDTEQHAAAWRFLSLLEQIPADKPIHLIGATQDTTTPPPLHIQPLYESLLRRRQLTSYAETADVHSYNTHRSWLIRQVYRCIAEMEQA